jgi:uncharacterized protein YjdB
MAPTPGVPAPSATPESNTVQVASAVRVKASQRTLRLKQGHSLRLTGYGYTDTGQRLKASWSSSAPSVAKVSALGKITALKPGKATVSLRVGAEAATVKVTVLRKSAPSPAVSKVEASVPKTLNVGETRYVTGTWAPTSATRVKATYKSANKAVAAIDSTGRLTAIGQGTTTITVEAGTKQAKYKIQVE